MPTAAAPSPLARLPVWLTPLLYAALHLLAVLLGLQLQVSRPSVAAFWPASGLALAALLLLPRRHWPGILGAAVVADLGANALLRPELAGIGPGLYVAGVGALESLIGAWLVTRFAGNPVDFADVRRTLAFVVTVAATTLVSGALLAVPFADALAVAGPDRAAQEDLGRRIATGAVCVVVDADTDINPWLADEAADRHLRELAVA